MFMGRWRAWAAVCIIILVGCSAKDSIDNLVKMPKEDTYVTTVIDEQSIAEEMFKLTHDETLLDEKYYTTGSYASNYEDYGRDESAAIDLDGDSKVENIYYMYGLQGEDGSYCILTVNDQALQINAMSTPLPQIAVVDIDESDSYKEMIISDEGPSDDYISRIYRYEEGAIQQVGRVEGLYDFGIGIDGEGHVMSRTRCDFLQTWFMDVPYKLVDGKLEVDGTVFKTYHPVNTKVDLPLYQAPEEDVTPFAIAQSPQFTIPAGEHITLVSVLEDGSQWCKVRTRGGEEGWFQVSGLATIAALQLEAEQVFDGLTYYD